MRTIPRAAWSLLGFAAANALPAQFVEAAVTRLYAVPGRAAGDLFGWRVRTLGDVNGDGTADFAVAAPFHNLNVGRVSVHSGATGAELWFRDETATSAILGFDLAVIDDADGDGVRDLVVADDANTTTRASRGQLFVYALPSLLFVRAVPPPAGGVLFGTALAFVGDTDGDLRDELAVGDRVTTSGSPGRMHLVGFDGTAPVVRWTATGLESGSPIDGNKFDGGGDVTGDGVPDVIADESFPADRARLFSGATGAVARSYTGAAGERTGRGAKIVDDQNHDGVPDVAIGFPSNAAGAAAAGRWRLYSGRDSRVLRQATAVTAGGRFGSDTDLLPDVSGDGWPEVVVAARGAPGTAPAMGGVHVLAGDPFLAGREHVGTAQPGTNGNPTLDVDHDPVLGTPFTLALASSTVGPTFGLLQVADTPGVTPAPWGGTQLVTTRFASPLTLPATMQLVVSVPADPALFGAVFCGQLLLADAGAPAGVASSRALCLVLGR
jgi:hypothetical protein